jgi:hypothetical protein
VRDCGAAAPAARAQSGSMAAEAAGAEPSGAHHHDLSHSLNFAAVADQDEIVEVSGDPEPERFVRYKDVLGKGVRTLG